VTRENEGEEVPSRSSKRKAENVKSRKLRTAHLWFVAFSCPRASLYDVL